MISIVGPVQFIAILTAATLISICLEAAAFAAGRQQADMAADGRNASETGNES